MLTATYSLVAIAAEQDNARSALGRLQHYLQSGWKAMHQIDVASVDHILGKLLQFDRYCRARKLESYIIPALRRATREADTLLSDLEALNASGFNILRAISAQIAATTESSSLHLHEIRHAMDVYCRNMWIRLEKEEKYLLPLARRVFTIDDWFSIASHFLSDESSTRKAAGSRNAPSIRLGGAQPSSSLMN